MADWVVELKDFQSIKSGKVTISRGLNVVTGATNQGKSAIFRAIDAAIFNTGTDDLVRAGKQICGVTISNGSHSMTYCRNAHGKNEKTAYQFDSGEVQRKVGRAQLPEVRDMFGVTDIRMQNGVKMKLNFWYQNDKPFLMDKTAGQLYEFLSLSSADRYVKILKSMGVDIKVQEAEINNSNTTIDTLKLVNNTKQDFVEKNDGFDDLYVKVITAGQEAQKLDKWISIVSTLENLTSKMSTVQENLVRVQKAYESVDIESVKSQYAFLNDKFLELSQIQLHLGSVQSLSSRVSTSVEQLDIVSNSYNRVEPVIEGAHSSYLELERLSKVIESIVGRLENLKISQNMIDSVQTSISSVDNRIPDINNLSVEVVDLESKNTNTKSLIDKLMSVKRLMDSVNSMTSSYEDAVRVCEDSEKEFEEFKSSVGYCPFCGSVLGACKHDE